MTMLILHTNALNMNCENFTHSTNKKKLCIIATPWHSNHDSECKMYTNQTTQV